MAILSTSTYLQVLNRALLASSERPLTAAQWESPSYTLGLQAKESVRTALTRLSQENWPWLEEYRSTAGTWTGNTFTVPGDAQRVVDVQVSPLNYNNYLSIPWISEELYRTFDTVTGVYATETSYPAYYTTPEDGIIAVYPWPSSVAGQNRVRIKIQRYLELPATITSTFKIPERFIPLLQLAVNADFCMKYTENTNQAQLYESQYQELLRQMRARHQNVPSGRMNMYKPLKGGTRHYGRQY